MMLKESCNIWINPCDEEFLDLLDTVKFSVFSYLELLRNYRLPQQQAYPSFGKKCWYNSLEPNKLNYSMRFAWKVPRVQSLDFSLSKHWKLPCSRLTFWSCNFIHHFLYVCTWWQNNITHHASLLVGYSLWHYCWILCIFLFGINALPAASAAGLSLVC